MGMTQEQALTEFRKNRMKKRHESRAFRRQRAREIVEEMKVSKKFPVRYQWMRLDLDPIFWLRKCEKRALIEECLNDGWVLRWGTSFFGPKYVELKPVKVGE